MKHYQHPATLEVFAFESDEERKEFGPPELVAMTAAQVKAHHAPKPLTPEQLKEQARGFLASTDWYVTRLTETGQAIPDEVAAQRAAARAAASS
jgi:hypothetical protein